MAEFKDRLMFAMNQNGLRAVDLAIKSGISKGSISQYLSGKINAKKNNIGILAHVLTVNPGWLMGLDVDMSSGEAEPKEKDHCDLLELLFNDDPAFLRKVKSIEINGKLNEPGIEAKLTDEQRAAIKSIIKMTYENAIRNGDKAPTSSTGIKLTPSLFA